MDRTPATLAVEYYRQLMAEPVLDQQKARNNVLRRETINITGNTSTRWNIRSVVTTKSNQCTYLSLPLLCILPVAYTHYPVAPHNPHGPLPDNSSHPHPRGVSPGGGVGVSGRGRGAAPLCKSQKVVGGSKDPWSVATISPPLDSHFLHALLCTTLQVSRVPWLLGASWFS